MKRNVGISATTNGEGLVIFLTPNTGGQQVVRRRFGFKVEFVEISRIVLGNERVLMRRAEPLHFTGHFTGSALQQVHTSVTHETTSGVEVKASSTVRRIILPGDTSRSNSNGSHLHSLRKVTTGRTNVHGTRETLSGYQRSHIHGPSPLIRTIGHANFGKAMRNAGANRKGILATSHRRSQGWFKRSRGIATAAGRGLTARAVTVRRRGCDGSKRRVATAARSGLTARAFTVGSRSRRGRRTGRARRLLFRKGSRNKTTLD